MHGTSLVQRTHSLMAIFLCLLFTLRPPALHALPV